MIKRFLNRTLLTLIIGVLAIAQATAQEPYVFLTGSTHKASVGINAGNSYQWKVYRVDQWSDQKDGQLAAINVDYEFVGEGENLEKNPNVDIRWTRTGKYYLIVEEFNGEAGSCSTRRAIPIEVIGNSLQIAFVDTQSEDCADGDNETDIQIKITSDGTTPLTDKYYDVTVIYTVKLGETVVKDKVSQTIGFDDVDENGLVDLHVDGIIEELDKTKVYTIIINETTDGYNTPFTIVPTKGTHTRTIHHLPQTGVMVQY